MSCTNNQLSDKEIKKTILFTIAIKLEYLEIKVVKDF